MVFDAVIVGAGPAGCSCALWLAEYGLRPLLVERAGSACAALDALGFAQEWVLGSRARTLAEIGAGYRAHIDSRIDIEKRYHTAPSSMSRTGSDPWRVEFVDGGAVAARNIVLATGVSTVHPPAYFNAELSSDALLDAVSLTRRRPTLTDRRVLLLGGGDNAAENALTLAEQGNAVTLSSRHALSGQRRFIDALATRASVRVRAGNDLPVLRRGDTDAGAGSAGYLAAWADGDESHFDIVAVLFGYQPNRELLSLLPVGIGPADGIFLAGDVSQRMHACVPCAVGDGAHVAWQIERRLADAPVAQIEATKDN